MWTVYFGALILGLSSSLHCLGMCGPLVMAVPVKSKNKWSKAFGITQYHIGKTFTYAVLGLMIGFVGLSVQTIKWMQILSVVSGVLIVFFAWEKFIKLPLGNKIQQKFTHYAGRSLRTLFQSNLPFKPLFFGMINGLLPCGLVYIALVNSLLAGGPFSSAMAMVFFGLGTVPILTLAKTLSTKIKIKSTWITPVLITMVGLMIVFRGLNLGIPMISPKMETNIIENEDGTIEEKAVVECCSTKEECEEVE